MTRTPSIDDDLVIDLQRDWGVHPNPSLILDLGDDAATTRSFGACLAHVIEPGQFIGLLGTLGAGKTTLMQGVLATLAPDHPVHSPTYSLVHLYDEATCPIAHLDLYRLNSPGDLESIGYWDLVSQQEHALCVEWFQRIPGCWPEWMPGLIIELVIPDEDPDRRHAHIWEREGTHTLSQAHVHTLESFRDHP